MDRLLARQIIRLPADTGRNPRASRGRQAELRGVVHHLGGRIAGNPDKRSRVHVARTVLDGQPGGGRIRRSLAGERQLGGPPAGVGLGC